MKELLLSMAGVGLTSTLVFAQTQTVRGVIVEAGNNEPIIGANVVVKGATGVGAVTNLEGRFSLNVPRGATHLIVSYVGYKTQEVAITSNMRIELKPQTEELGDVVIIGYGTVKRESLVGAQTTISAKNLEKRPITNVSSAFSGLTPGLSVTTSAGQPGGSETLRIRGFGSLNASSAPIIVVDGAVYNGALGDINPQDIQSLNILKDAASTAIYGASAGNGVVLITTKSGRMSINDKPSFNFTMNQGISQRGASRYETIDVWNHHRVRWQQWFNENKYNLGQADAIAGANAAKSVYESLMYNPFAGIRSYYEVPPGGANLVLTKTPVNKTTPAIILPDGSLNPEINGLLWGDDLDWEGALFRIGYRQEYNFSGSYSNKKLKSYFSASYLNEEGYRIATSFERFTGRANLSYNFTDWLEAGTNTSYSTAVSMAPKRASGSYSSNSFNFIQEVAPIYPIHRHNADGSYVLENGEKVYDYSQTRPYTKGFNPVYESLIDLSKTERDMLSTKNYVKLTPLKGLTLTMNMSLDLSTRRERVRYNNVMGDQPKGLFLYNIPRWKTTLFNQLLDYQRSFGKNNFSLLLGHESYAYRNEKFESTKKNAVWTGVDEHDNYVEMDELTSNIIDYHKESFFGRLNYDYDAKYNASVSFRRDGSSRFHKDHRWGNFWSVGAGWNVHKEDFLKNIEWVNELKLRASYGQTGVDDLIDSDGNSLYYPYRTLFDLNKNNNLIPGTVIRSAGNQQLIWETQVSADLALEFRLFNRLHGTVEYFVKESKDLIFSVPKPPSTGVQSVSENIGKSRNWGVELDLGYDILQGKDLRWTVKANATFLNNKLVRLPDLLRSTGIETGIYKYEEGRSIYDYYLKEFIGVDPNDGKAIYRLDNVLYPDNADPNSANFKGMEKTGEKATWTKEGDLAKKHFAGTSIPTVSGGFGTELVWKDLDFSVGFAYQLGGKSYDGGYRSLMMRDLTGGSAMHVDLYNAWKKPGDVTNVPRLTSEGTEYSTIASDRFLTSRSALMLKSISLGYTLPKSFLSRFGINGARVSIAGENLFLISARKGLNPMSNFSGQIGSANYGFAKTITASLNLTL